MVLASLVSGAGATGYMDGWHACGPQSCFGALYSGDIETLEYSYPILIHRYGLVTDSAGAGQYRGGSGTVWEVEPIGHEMTVVSFGEGRKLPAIGANGASSALPETKLGRVDLKRHGKVIESHQENAVMTVRDGYCLATYNPGGGGWGSPLLRDPEQVATDVRNGIVSIGAAHAEYGVVIDEESLRVDRTATDVLRASRR